jgi:hypothetical protein
MVSNKTGLSYFGIDTDIFQDRKIKRLKKTFGCAGIAIHIYLLCDVYRDRGCVLAWDEDCAFDVAEYLGVKESLVNEVVKYCGAVGLFNEELLSRGIITSESIQRRYIEMCKRARRSSTNIPEEWRLITEESGKITEECGETTEDCGVTPTFSDKEKKSKVKKSKEKESECENAHTHTPTQEEIQDFEELKNFQSWCEAYAPTLAMFKEPLTAPQLKALRKKYTLKKILQCVTEVHNKEAYTQGRSAFYTLDNWLQRMR